MLGWLGLHSAPISAQRALASEYPVLPAFQNWHMSVLCVRAMSVTHEGQELHVPEICQGPPPCCNADSQALHINMIQVCACNLGARCQS